MVRTAQRNGDQLDAYADLRERAPFTDHWVRRLDDASGVDGEWYPRERVLNGWVEALLRIEGELYLPFLVANAEAFARGLERLEIGGVEPALRFRAIQIPGEMPPSASR